MYCSRNVFVASPELTQRSDQYVAIADAKRKSERLDSEIEEAQVCSLVDQFHGFKNFD